ncbi:MAG: 3-oxoacyl-ACP reductase FabG [Oscillospiraceae bacterium]
MNKTALVTGAGVGIGAATAEALAKKGYNVAICCNKNAKRAKELSQRLNAEGCSTAVFTADLSDISTIDTLFCKVESTFGSVDILVNNAGIAQQKMFCDISESDFDKIMNTNFKGAFFTSQRALAHMLHQKWGRIINVASMWGEVGASCEVHYSASKAALIGFTKALAKEEAPSGITVNAVSPGAIDTEMLNNLSEDDKKAIAEDTPVMRLGKPQEIAAAIAFLASDEAEFITGQVLGVNGGLVI